MNDLNEALIAELRLWRSLVHEGGMPRYTVVPSGAALNSVVTSTDGLLRRAANSTEEPADPALKLENKVLRETLTSLLMALAPLSVMGHQVASLDPKLRAAVTAAWALIGDED